MAGIALQMYTVRDDAARDFVGTMRKVAEIGYPAVELAGMGGLTPEQVRDLCAELGLVAAGTHVGLDALEKDFAGMVHLHHTIGAVHVTVPSIPQDRFPRTEEAYRRAGTVLAEMGRRLRAEGLQLAYHNHAHEFFATSAGTGMDTLYAESDPEDLHAELDVYWARKGGEDPAAYIRKLGARCRLLHIKDMATDGSFAEIGTGELDFPAIFAAGAEVGTEWYIVEQDSCQGPPLEAVAISRENLRKWGW
jgi:sugar phosphate isomerase/epimerase